MTTLNRQQDDAVKMGEWLVRNPRCVGILAGPAGTGKTQTIKAILDRVGPALIVAPTGRAALRAAQVTGRPDVYTCHRWLFVTEQHPSTGQIVFVERPRLPDEPGCIYRPNTPLVIVEEASMLGPELNRFIQDAARDLGLSILYVGDPFQLPPVAMRDEEAFSVFESIEVDRRVDLTEVFRQALDSIVLRVATNLRLGRWSQVRKILDPLPRCRDAVSGTGTHFLVPGADGVTIAHRNETRQSLNRLVRKYLEIDPLGPPQKGEPLLVRRNNTPAGVFNGEIIPFTGWIEPPKPFGAERDLVGVMAMPNGVRVAITPSTLLGLGKEPGRYALTLIERKLNASYLRAHYGYALTCHAAQGSEWDDVILVLESSIKVMDERDRMRWLYTATTRARESVALAGPNFGRGGE